jgi:hypothetical protein
MKLFGQSIKGPNVEVLALPRDGKVLVIKAQAILDTDAFETVCPRPKPPRVQRPGKGYEDDPKDEGFLAQLSNWAQKKTDWMVVTSLAPTEGLEWERVKLDQPETWKEWRKELQEAFFSDREVQLILTLVFSVNSLSEAHLEEARKRFLAGEAELLFAPSSPMVGQKITPSGEAANASV